MNYEVNEEFVERVRDELDIEVRPNYSGRYMYAKTCFAIVGGPSDLIRFALNLSNLLEEISLDEEAWHNVCWDSMANDLVFYWPEVHVSDEESDPDADFGGRLNPVDFS